MRKQILAALLAFCVALTFLPVSVFAEEVTVVASGECGAQGDNVTWTLDSEGTLTISGTGEMADFGTWASGSTNIPWKDNMQSITEAKVTAGVTSIGNYSFQAARNLRSVEIPFGVTRIGYCAFVGCSNLSTMVIPDSVTIIEAHSFHGCTNLNSIDISNSVISIEDCAFRDCTNLTSVTLPESLTIIGDSAFSWCTSLTNISIPSGVISLGDFVFGWCSSLYSVTLTDGLVSISEDAFYLCANLTYINIPRTVTAIGTDAFAGCSSLTSVTIPSSVVNFGNTVFRGCDALVDVVFEEGVTGISYGTFEHCDNLASVSIPSSVTKIGSAAFANCPSLTDITIPSGVKEINDVPFYFCTGLTEIIVDVGNAFYTAVDGVLFTKNLSALVAYPIGNAQTTYTIPDGVATINLGAFIHCANLTSMSIPVSVTTVECDATSECYNLKDVYYDGTKEQWEQIQFLNHPTGDHRSSDVLRDATIHFADEPNKTCTLSGAITGHQGVAYASVTAKLVGLDGTVYPAAVTDGEALDGTTKKECTYSVSAPAGQYDLVVEATAASGAIVNRTALVKLSGDQMKNVNLPNGQAKSNVTVNTSAAGVIAGNLDSLIVSDDGSLIAGTSAEVTLIFTIPLPLSL